MYRLVTPCERVLSRLQPKHRDVCEVWEPFCPDSDDSQGTSWINPCRSIDLSPRAYRPKWFICVPVAQERNAGGGDTQAFSGCCGAEICVTCMTHYLSGEIVQKSKVELLCPGQCRRSLVDSEIEDFVDTPTMQKLHRFRTQKAYSEQSPSIRRRQRLSCSRTQNQENLIEEEDAMPYNSIVAVEHSNLDSSRSQCILTRITLCRTTQVCPNCRCVHSCVCVCICICG